MLHKWQWELHDLWINKIYGFICAPETCFQRAAIITHSVIVVVVLQCLQCSTHYYVLQLHRKHSSAHQIFLWGCCKKLIPDSVITNPTVKLQTYLDLLYSSSEVIDTKIFSLSIVMSDLQYWVTSVSSVLTSLALLCTSHEYFFVICVSNEIQRVFHSVLFLISFSVDLFILLLQIWKKVFISLHLLTFIWSW